MTNNIKKLMVIITAVALIIILSILTNTLMIKLLYKKDYSEYVTRYSQQYSVDENLIYALIKAESNFKMDAESSKGAKGLMQLMPSTAEDVAKKNDIELSEKSILEPDTNINIGTKYISTLIEKYDCIEIALAAYNAGSGNVDKWIANGTIKADGSNIEKIKFKETNNYVRKTMRDYKIYNKF